MNSTTTTQIYEGRAQELLLGIADESIDMVIADLPYGKIKSKWDTPFDIEWFWGQIRRVTKKNAAVLCFAQGNFAIDLITSNRKEFRYDLIWEKDRPTGHLNAKKMPMRSHEYLLVFYRKLPTYNPQMVTSDIPTHSRGNFQGTLDQQRTYGKYEAVEKIEHPNLRYPRSILRFKRPHPAIHPTQKPLELCQWAIRTFTNPGEIVFDPSFGSGTTLLAAVIEGRNSIGIESDPIYADLTRQRLLEYRTNEERDADG